MNVLSVAYPIARVSRDSTGGAEQILSQVEAAIVAAGHRSIVIAAEGSRVAGTLVPIPVERGPLDAPAVGRAHASVAQALASVLEDERVDVVHMHGMDFDRYLPAPGPPVLVTLHVPPSWYSRQALGASRPRTHFCCVSRAQHAALPVWATPAHVVENGVATSAFRPRHRKAGFCLVLARICPEKGIQDALDAADEAGVPLVIGGDVAPFEAHARHAEALVRERIRPPHRWLGAVDFARKRRLLAAARALLVPSRAQETSSLVAMEALACGTPVIAYRSGALPDIVEHGKTGFIVDDARAMAEAIGRAHEIAPTRCREAAVTRFSGERMSAGYLALYERLAHEAVYVAPRIVTEEVRGHDALERLAPEWCALWDRCATASPFQRPEWLLAYARAFCGPANPSGAEPWAVVVRRDGELVGLAPLCTRGRRTTLLGDGVSDYLDVLVDRACASTAIAALLEALARLSARGGDVELDGLRKCSPLRTSSAPRGCRVEELEGDACACVALPAAIDPIAAPLRAHVRRYLRRAERVGGAAIVHATRPDEVRDGLEVLFTLHGARWATRGQVGVLAAEPVRAFLRDAVPALAAAGAARIGMFRAGGRPAAVDLVLRDTWADCGYISGFDPSFASMSPGIVLLVHEIDLARRDGRAEFDFLRGRESYKYRFGARDRSTFRRRLMGHIVAG